jgi:AraC-like DNA-binding protein
MTQSESESLPRRQTDPAWLQDHFLGTGHDENTRNGTFTFVQRHGRHYAVTCRHIMDGVADPEIVPAATHPTMALHIDKAVLNLSYISRAQFFRTFKQSTGLSPHRFLVRLRINQAKALLETSDISIGDLSRATGFATAGAFADFVQAASRSASEALHGQSVVSPARAHIRALHLGGRGDWRPGPCRSCRYGKGRARPS